MQVRWLRRLLVHHISICKLVRDRLDNLRLDWGRL
jgi:hypothetical protein